MNGYEIIIKILRDAILKETEAFNYYRRASLKSVTVETESLLIQLAEEERKHRIFLLQEMKRLEKLMGHESPDSLMDQSEVRFLLPEKIPFKRMKTIPRVDMATVCLPVEFFGGDFIDSFTLENRNGSRSLAVLMYDVMGHGLNATRLKSEAKKAFGNIRETWVRERRNNTTDLTHPKEMMKDLNRMLIQDTVMTNQFITALYGILNPEKGTLTYTSAGHDPPILVNTEGKYVHLNNTQLLIGAERQVDYQEVDVPIKTGDVVVIFSDGITEAANRKNELFGRERIQIAVHRHLDKSAQLIAGFILGELREFLDGEPVTDELMLCVLKIN